MSETLPTPPLALVGVTLAAPAPVGLQHLRLSRGLSSLYGKNGVGKTRVLAALERLLSPDDSQFPVRSQDEHHYFESLDPLAWTPASPATAFYGAGGVHLHYPVEPPDLVEQAQPDLVVDSQLDNWFGGSGRGTYRHRGEFGELAESLEQAAADWFLSHPWIDSPEMREHSLLAALGLDESGLRKLLADGRWFYQPALSRIFLCDADPWNSPLTAQWERWTEYWATSARKSSHTGGLRLGDLVESDGYLEWGDGWTFPDRDLVGSVMPYRRRSALLMPLPEVLKLSETAEWVAFPIVSLPFAFETRFQLIADGLPMVGRAGSEKRSVSEQLTDVALRRLPSHWTRERKRRREQLRAQGGHVFGPDPTAFEDAVDEAMTLANELMVDMFDDPPLLRARVRGWSDWVKGRCPVAWEANTARDGPWFPLEHLGAAHLRYARFAIERALDMWVRRSQQERFARMNAPAASPDPVTFLIIDEPERALHVAAERKLAAAAGKLADVVVVSTHSTEFLEYAVAGPGEVMHLERRPDGFASISGNALSLAPAMRQQIADRWGLTPARLAAMTGVFLFVEGPHDELVIEHFLEPELKRTRAVIVPMSGTRRAAELPFVDLVLRSTDAPVVVCLDNSSNAIIERALSELGSRRPIRAKLGYLGDRERDREFSTPEMKVVLDLLKSAASSGHVHRVHPYGLRRRDITEYLPVHTLHPGYRSWDSLDKAFLASKRRSHFVKGDGRAKKSWINDTGGDLSIAGIKRALSTLSESGDLTSERDEDFERLAALILGLSSRK